MATISGRISLHRRGFGFLEHEGGAAFVSPPDLTGFLADDRVWGEVTTGEDGRQAATGLVLIERPRRCLFGRVRRDGAEAFIEVDRQVANGDWPIDSTRGMRAGSWWMGEIDGDRLRPLEKISSVDAARVRVLERWRIRVDSSPVGKIPRSGESGRRDLRELTTITIDSEKSRDLDDALSVLPAQEDGAVRVIVSIADVDSAVPEGSALDEEARARGTSVYLADGVVNMLPPELSEDLLSLIPGVDRLAISVELRIDAEGRVTATDIFTSKISSTARLSYTGVAAYFDRGDAGAIPDEALPTVRWLRAAAGRLGSRRAGRGGLSIVRDEAHIEVEDGVAKSLEAVPPTSAHLLIERLMVATNEAVAEWVQARGLPALFRVHPEPEPEKVLELAEFAAGFGFETGFGDAGRLTPLALAAFEQQMSGSDAEAALRTALNRTLGPARYSATAELHFGLASPLYLHFTSPIRRYADLRVHRVVKSHLEGRRATAIHDPELIATAAHLNDCALRSRRAEADRFRMFVAAILDKRRDEDFPARVIAQTSVGWIVQLAGLGVTARLAIPEGARIVIGQSLTVRVTATDEDEGQVDVESPELASRSSPRPPQRSGRRGRPNRRRS